MHLPSLLAYTKYGYWRWFRPKFRPLAPLITSAWAFIGDFCTKISCISLLSNSWYLKKKGVNFTIFFWKQTKSALKKNLFVFNSSTYGKYSLTVLYGSDTCSLNQVSQASNFCPALPVYKWRSRSAGFWRSQLIRIHTTFHAVFESIAINRIMPRRCQNSRCG